METITNAASSVVNTASNLIYGQPAKDNEITKNNETGGSEPVSGQQGKGTANEPFDQGNLATASNETGGQEPISGQQGKGTVNEPFDQGNAANPIDATSKTNTASTAGNTSYKQDDFLTLSPEVGKPTETATSTHNTTGGTGATSMPIVPLNPDVATMSSGKSDINSSTTTGITEKAGDSSSSTATGITDKAGVTDKVWKPTALDDVSRAGAPGAGPTAPEYTPATPDMSSSTSNKASEPVGVTAIKDTTPSADSHNSSTSKESHAHSEPTKQSVGDNVDAILESMPKSKHTVDDREAEAPHSKMTGTTVRQTEASQHGESGNSKSLATEKAGTKSESHTSADPTSPTSDEKSGGKKMSQLKDKLKDKLHIGSKDK